MMSYIQLTDIHKKYNIGKPSEVHALKGINLEIEKGDMVAISGVSGSGKSTLLHIIGCIDKMTSGNYFLDGKDISKMNDIMLSRIRNQTVGFVLQEYGLLLDRTALENVSIPLLFSNTKLRSINMICLEMLDQLGIRELAKRKVSDMSGGQRQRVAIVRAMINEPEILLADEPTGALDTKTAAEIMDIFKEINESGKTVIIVTHDEKVTSKCNRKMHLVDGCITVPCCC